MAAPATRAGRHRSSQRLFASDVVHAAAGPCSLSPNPGAPLAPMLGSNTVSLEKRVGTKQEPRRASHLAVRLFLLPLVQPGEEKAARGPNKCL